MTTPIQRRTRCNFTLRYRRASIKKQAGCRKTSAEKEKLNSSIGERQYNNPLSIYDTLLRPGIFSRATNDRVLKNQQKNKLPSECLQLNVQMEEDWMHCVVVAGYFGAAHSCCWRLLCLLLMSEWLWVTGWQNVNDRIHYETCRHPTRMSLWMNGAGGAASRQGQTGESRAAALNEWLAEGRRI